MFPKIDIVSPTSLDLGENFGLSLKRRDEIAKNLDNLMKASKSGEIRLVYVWQIVKEIENICETQEEFIWALLNHMQWHFKGGRMLIPI